MSEPFDQDHRPAGWRIADHPTHSVISTVAFYDDDGNVNHYLLDATGAPVTLNVDAAIDVASLIEAGVLMPCGQDRRRVTVQVDYVIGASSGIDEDAICDLVRDHRSVRTVEVVKR